MGYSRNKNALLKVEPFLALLVKTEKELFVPSNNPRETVYAIRDGLNYAETHKVEPYKELKSKFRLIEKRDGFEVKLRNSISIESPIEKLAHSQNLVVDKVKTLMELIGAVILHKAPRFEFPKAEVEGDARTRLEKWAANNNYKVSYNPHIILERIDAEKDGGVKFGEHGMVRDELP
jgi:hypothetical protein